MPLVPAVTELIIAELLYLNYESTADPITMYIIYREPILERYMLESTHYI